MINVLISSGIFYQLFCFPGKDFAGKKNRAGGYSCGNWLSPELREGF
jgi:hypothetical protein